jgi:hypothetical protein
MFLALTETSLSKEERLSGPSTTRTFCSPIST